MEIQVNVKLTDLADIFPARLKEFMSATETMPSKGIYRLEIPIASCDPLKWLKGQTHPHKIYWAGRESEFITAAVGSADIIKGNESPQAVFKKIAGKITRQSPEVRYYGGFCFDSNNFSAPWEDFGQNCFIAPRFEIVKTPQKTVFACNLNYFEKDPKSFAKIIHQFEEISFSTSRMKTTGSTLKSQKAYPSAAQWQKTVSKEISEIKKGILKKVVLARQAILEFDENIDALSVLGELQDISSNCYYFYFQPGTAEAFLGASPERLYKRQGLDISTEALAGTRPRGRSQEEDQKLKNTLLNSEKDWYEHQLVVDWMRNVLNPMCSQFQVERAFSALSLKGGHHLCTRMKGQLLEMVDDATLIERLHPTPAVGGWPKEKALEIIKKSEPFSRGYYAAPLGFVGYDAAEFSVAIRSGLVQKNKITLYSGSGIVDASQPQDEWSETENKLNVFLQALGL